MNINTIFFLFLICTQAFPKGIKELNKKELSKIFNGEALLFEKEIKDRPWPQVTLYTISKRSPINAMSIFAAFDIQKDYTPKVIKSSPIGMKSSSEVTVEYELELPLFLDNATYTHGHKLEKLSKGHYKLSWYMIKSSTAKEVNGSVEFFIYQDRTILKYTNLVYPDSFFASMLKKIMLKDVKKTVLSIRDYIDIADDKTVTKYRKILNDSLNNRPVYNLN